MVGVGELMEVGHLYLLQCMPLGLGFWQCRGGGWALCGLGR